MPMCNFSPQCSLNLEFTPPEMMRFYCKIPDQGGSVLFSFKFRRLCNKISLEILMFFISFLFQNNVKNKFKRYLFVNSSNN